MIKIDKVETYGWEAAIRGMRNSFNSWDKSDSFCSTKDECHKCSDNQRCDYYFSEMGDGIPVRNRNGVDTNRVYIGHNDLELMLKLAKAGGSHAKYRRMIGVTMDVLAPLYYWKEFSTYKVGTVANSCSTMHKIAEKEFTIDDFSNDHLFTNDWVADKSNHLWCASMTHLETTVNVLNAYRFHYIETGDKEYWWQIIQLLPSSYNQLRTVNLNYEVLSHIYKDRKGHRLTEWNDFCDWIETLPYSEIITLKEEHGNG